MATKTKQAQLLKRFIHARRLTQNELALALDISPSYLSRILRGDRRLGSDKALEASRLIGVPMEALFQ